MMEQQLAQNVSTDSAGKSLRREAGCGTVVVYRCKPATQPHGHERVSQSALARRLAAIKGYEFGGEFDPGTRYQMPLYFIPSDTIATLGLAGQLGILGEHDLFGGVVPFPFVATKVITHPLAHPEARAPAGWSPHFAQRTQQVVLPGFSVFTADDARAALAALLPSGTVRLKKASGIGGAGQTVIASADMLETMLASPDAHQWLPDGVVLERNLTDVATHSVGQVRVDNLLATYCGIQHTTRNHHGEEVYGGSQLTVVRGDFNALLELALDDATRTAIAQARAYHAAALSTFPGMLASRCNYDVAQGTDEAGQWHSGVLEQSWRIGGASGAEIVALDAFLDDPALAVVCASTTEIYQADPVLPPGALVYCQQVDERVGPITKYAQIEPYANP